MALPWQRNPGVIFDQDMCFNAHIYQIWHTAFLHLRNMSKIRIVMSKSHGEIVVHASLLVGSSIVIHYYRVVLKAP